MFTNTLLQMILGYDAFGNKLMEYGSFLRLVTTSGKPRIGGCAVVLSILSMAFAIQSMKRQLWNRTLLYASAVLCGMVVVVLSGERTALLLLACSIALYLLLEKSIPLGIKFLLSGAFISSMVVIFLLLEQSVYYRMVEMMLYQIHNFKTDAYGRIYCTAWQMWLANPWFGIGSNAFFHECTMFLQERMNESLRCGAHPHNIYLQLMVENGMVGFMLFIGIIIRWYRNLKLTTGDSIATLSICLMSSRLLPFLPANNIYHAYSLLPIIMILGLSRNIRS
jgi:O-antigen ligase